MIALSRDGVHRGVSQSVVRSRPCSTGTIDGVVAEQLGE